MSEERENKIAEFIADEFGTRSYKQGKSYNGYDVYIPQFKQTAFTGLPYVVLVKGDEMRLSTPDEALDYLGVENT